MCKYRLKTKQERPPEITLLLYWQVVKDRLRNNCSNLKPAVTKVQAACSANDHNTWWQICRVKPPTPYPEISIYPLTQAVACGISHRQSVFSPFPRSLPSKVFVEIFLSLKQIRVGKGEKSWWLLLLVTKSWTVAGAALLGLHVKLPRSLSAASPKLSRLSVRSSRLVVDTWAAGMKTLKK